MKTVIVKQDFPYAGIKRKKGERIQLSNHHAKILGMAGKVTEDEGTKDFSPPPSAIVRQDMRAEDETTVARAPRGGRGSGRRGRYARSDMRSES